MLWVITFWLAVFYLANSALGLIRAMVDYDWYAERLRRRGIEPCLRRLLTRKAVTLTSGVFIACLLGAKAGYL